MSQSPLIFERFVEVFGEDAIFPVVDTPIGRLGVMVCGFIQNPEVARALALKGVEVLIHPTAEIIARQITAGRLHRPSGEGNGQA